MASDGPNATWHPAFMPHNTDKAEAAATAAAPAPDAPVPATPDGPDAHGADAWFPEYDAGSPWSEHPAPQPADPPAPEPETTPVASPVDATASKHMSTISFTRTVANDVNWDADDDDPEWSLSRSDTDPFQFMPPSDRSNSFPVVPPLPAEPPAAQPPLPSSQAMDIIQEVDSEVSRDAMHGEEAKPSAEQSAAAVDAWARATTSDGAGNDDDDAFFAGAAAAGAATAGEQGSGNHTQTAPWEEPDARYEEGVPLIPAAPADAEAQDPFAEAGDGGDDDDFFASASLSAAAETADPQPVAPPAFERKSTMQVLQSMNVGSLSRADTITEDAAAEDDEPAQKPNGTEGDLAAKWAAVLDDEDELLLEDAPPEPTEAAPSKPLDPAAFFGDDDEGFLDDAQDMQPPVSQPTAVPQQPPAAPTSRYLPPAASGSQAQPPQQPANPYLPTPAFTAAAQPVVPSPYSAAAPTQFASAYGYSATGPPPLPPQERPALRKAESFVDKPKGGYTSPYDLPMDVVKPPRKRQSMQQLSRAADAASAPPQRPPPPRSSSMHSPATAPTLPPHTPIQAPPVPTAAAAPPAAARATPQPIKHESFFEDLPVLPKVRPASRHSQPSPSHATPFGAPPLASAPLQHPPLPPPSAHYAPPTAPGPLAAPPSPQPAAAQAASSAIAGLVAPPRASPYAALPTSPPLAPPAPAAGVSRYSPSLNQLPPPPAPGAQPSRYSPAPPSRAPSAGYAPMSTPPILPHQPRTSSPLAHFEMSYDKPRATSVGHAATHAGENHIAERRSSSSVFEPRLNRVSSLAPTREEEEELSPRPRPASSGTGAYQPLRQTPPPLPPAQTVPVSQPLLSPPKRALNYAPPSSSDNQPAQMSPPRRSQTQSPSALYGSRHAAKPVDPIPRPSSVHEAAAPPLSRPRAASQSLNLVPPTDGSETDPLQRWKGAPIFAWGVGGTFVSSFPQDVPRYGMNQALPMIHRAAGEVQVKALKELQPLEDRLSKFPGPLKGKSKKKEVLAWLTTGIEDLERSLPTAAFNEPVSLEDKRLEERVVLWKILRLFVEHDGVLEGTPAVDKAVRDVLVPDAASALAASGTEEPASALVGAGYPGFAAVVPTTTQADAIDSSVVEQIRKSLLLGDKEKAAWDAVDKRLWGHAFLVAGAASRELFKKVAQEFVHKEVNTPGLNNESLAALYEVLSGNHEECVDELVPVHARAGLQLMTTQQPALGQPRGAGDDGLAGLDKWRETLCLVLSNRSVDDVQAINSLGSLLAGYGRAEAAHVCYLFARSVAVFGGLDDPAANYVLLGADHKRQADSFAKETDAVLLSEVYEYGLSLAGGSNLGAASCPHLAAYKLQHAIVLAEYGLRDKALQYCETIVAAMTGQTRRSPYYHPLLETAVEDLMKRLKQAPKEESSGSWIPKPSMNKVSDTVWNRFNKFVAGDDNEGAGTGADGDSGAESGPFARLAAGGTPTISRPPSSGGPATGMEMFGGQASSSNGTAPVPAYGFLNGAAATAAALPLSLPTATAAMAIPSTRAAARYAPGAPAPMLSSSAPAYTSAPYSAAPSSRASSRHVSAEQAANEPQQASPYAPRTSSELSPGYSPYAALAPPAAAAASRAPSLSRKSSYTPLSQAEPTPPMQEYAPMAPEPQPSYNPYAPPGSGEGAAAAQAAASEDKGDSGSSGDAPGYGYQAPSYGYEPPSFEAGNAGFEAPKSEPAEDAGAGHQANGDANGYGGYEPPSFQPYSYEPPSYESPAGDDANGDADEAPRPKKTKSFLDDDDDDIPALSAKPAPAKAEKTREEKERESAERFRRLAEEDAKRAEAEKAKASSTKKGWGLTSWFGGGKKDDGMGGGGGGGGGGGEGTKAVRANLGEKSSFYFDPELKRWVNKNASPEEQARSAAATPAPPPPPSSSAPGPPRSNPPSIRSTPPPPPMAAGAPPLAGPPGGPPAMVRTASGASTASGPPSRPATGVSDANSIDDLLGGLAGPRKAGAKKGRKSGRYVDVMAK